MVRRLGDKNQRVNLASLQQAPIKKVQQAKNRQVRHANARLDNPVFVVPHHFLEFERTRLGEIEIFHILNKRLFSRRHYGKDAGDAFASECEIHCLTPLLRRSVSIVSWFLKFSGTISTPWMEMLKFLSNIATKVTTSKESSIPSAIKSLEAAKSNSGRISFS